MLKDMKKLEIDENDSMYKRTVDDRNQLLLPKQLTPLVYQGLMLRWDTFEVEDLLN